jgi:type II secretory pathway pseudopilin PulG
MPAGKAARKKLKLGSDRGFTYAAVLVAMLVLALATQGVMTFVSQQVQRERESDLLRIGQTYAAAIGAFYEASPGNVKSWPKSLEDLIEDKRFVSVRRHLREVYPDPITRSSNWGLTATLRSRRSVTPLSISGLAPFLPLLAMRTGSLYTVPRCPHRWQRPSARH